MTPAELIHARAALGLTAADLGRALQLDGRDPGQTIRRWERGLSVIPGPAAVAIALFLEIGRAGPKTDRPPVPETVKEAPAPAARPTAAPTTPALLQHPPAGLTDPEPLTRRRAERP